MSNTQDRPIIVQSDRSILLETDGPAFEDARDCIAAFAELVKSPEHIHTYRISPLSLWNAAASGMSVEQILEGIERYSKYEVPQNIIADVRDNVARYGRIKLYRAPDGDLVLASDEVMLIVELLNQRSLQPYISGSPDPHHIIVKPGDRGNVKCALIKIGYPVEDVAGYVVGEPLKFDLRSTTLGGRPFGLRSYQTESVDAFHMHGSNHGGSGAVVLPCGAGKTIVGIGAMHALQTHTLVLTTNTIALRQWRSELIDKTTLTSEQIGSLFPFRPVRRGELGPDHLR